MNNIEVYFHCKDETYPYYAEVKSLNKQDFIKLYYKLISIRHFSYRELERVDIVADADELWLFKLSFSGDLHTVNFSLFESDYLRARMPIFADELSIIWQDFLIDTLGADYKSLLYEYLKDKNASEQALIDEEYAELEVKRKALDRRQKALNNNKTRLNIRFDLSDNNID